MPESSHEIRKSLPDKLKAAVPFGLGHTKPKHYRDMFGILWQNRDNLPYAWKVLSRGVCDGCALGVAGLHDWTIKGTHMCMTRLNLMRLNTVGPFDPTDVADVSKVRGLNNKQLRDMGRIPCPLLWKDGAAGYERITWDQANELVGGTIRDSTPDRIAFFVTSRGVTNEVYYVAQKVARYLGTNNVDNAARLCHSPSTGAMKPTLGVAATTCSYSDWFGTDVIVFFGANPANDQPVTTKYLHEAKKRGSKVIVVNPYREPGMQRYWVPSTTGSALFGTDIMDYWFPVAQGGDIAFMYGAMKVMIERGYVDETFIAEHTNGFDELRAMVESLDWKLLERRAGLSRASMAEFAELIGRASTGVLVWSMGITQHTFGADGVQQILNLGLMRGFLGRDKCGLMPIRGHSSVQGGAEMGAYSTVFPGGKAIDADNAAALAEQYGFDVPSWTGLESVEMVEAAGRGDLDLLYCVGGNFLRTLPDPNRVAQTMRNVPLRVHQDIILTDQMFIPPRDGGAVLLLPAATRYEQEGGGIETTTERRVCFSPEIPRQVGEAKTEWRILRDIARAVDPERFDASGFGCDSGQAIREEIARVVPMYDGVQHLKETGDAIQYGGPHLCPGGVCPTPDGRANFRGPDVPDNELADGEFHVSTRRGKQFNTLIYAERDPITGADRDAVFMNAADAKQLGVHEGTRVTLANDTGRYAGRIKLVPIAPRTLQVHWPEGNVIIPAGKVDRLGGVPDYNAKVRVER